LLAQTLRGTEATNVHPVRDHRPPAGRGGSGGGARGESGRAMMGSRCGHSRWLAGCRRPSRRPVVPSCAVGAEHPVPGSWACG